MNWVHNPSTALKIGLSTLTLLICLGSMLGQVAWFNFETLSRDNRYRSLYGSACQFLGCKLPPLQDIQQIQSSNLMVRSHPKHSGALVVDAILINNAAFQQNFPLLELQFTNITGELVANRHFKPNEYLAGELSGAKIMPSRQAIHLALDIIDPGSEAINYSMRIRTAR